MPKNLTKPPQSFMPFNSIKDRESDTRKLKEKHVKALEESILAIGLIEPLVVDQDGVLLAGGHRKAAIKSLIDGPSGGRLINNLFPEGIPVRVMSFSSSDDPNKALQVEIAENEHRKDYTAKEIQAIAELLKEQGFEQTKGRPKKGQKSLIPALSAVVGKSKRRVQEILQEDSAENTRNRVFSESNTYLRRAIANLEKWQKVDSAKPKELSKQIERMLEELREGMGQS